MSASKLPQPGDTIPSVYIYTLTLNVSAVGLGLVDIVNPVATAHPVTFGVNSSGSETISYTDNSGNVVTQSISGVGMLQDSSAFTYTSGGTTYLLSDTALNGLLNVTLNNTSVNVLPAATFSTTQGQYVYPASGTVVAPSGLTLAPASDSGTKGDGITNVATPVITGTGGAGTTVTLQDESTTIGTATVGSNGTWSITTTALSNGQHTLTAFDTDASGSASSRSAALTLTIDTTIPAAPAALALAVASDSGAKGDGITNVTTPTITGTGIAGDIVTLSDSAGIVGTATVAANGTWSVTTGTLAANTYSLTATQTDVAGTVSAASNPLSLTIDTTIPAAPATLALAAASDSGAKGDNITNVTAPTITGTGTAGDTISLFDGATLVGTTTVGSNGTWSVTTSILASGPNSLTATQTEIAGNASAASNPLSLTIDTTIPAAPATLALAAASDSGAKGDNITNVATPTITGTGTAGDTINLYDGSSLVGTTTVGSNGTWSVTTRTLPNGTNSLTATQTEIAGNVSPASSALSLTIDTSTPVAPSTPVLSAASDSGAKGDGITNVTTPVITGTGTAGDTVTLSDSAGVVGTTIVAGNGTWSITTGTLAPNTYSLTATQTDVAGTVSPASNPLSLTIDTTIPAAPATLALAAASDSGAKGDGITNVATPTITGTGTAGDTINLYDGSSLVGTTTVGSNGTWSVTTGTLPNGTNSLTATQIEIAGNVSPASSALSLTIDTSTPVAPSTPVLSAASDSGAKGDGITNVATPVITGTGTAGDTVSLYDGTTLVGTTMVGSNGAWSVTTGTLASGSNSLTATQADIAGTVSAASAALSLTIDTATPATPSAPQLSAASDSGTKGDGITNIATPTVIGTGTAGDTVSLYDGGTLVGTATVASSGIWSVTSSTLAAGLHTLTATQSDVAGNVSLASTGLTLNIETAPPSAPSAPVTGRRQRHRHAGRRYHQRHHPHADRHRHRRRHRDAL